MSLLLKNIRCRLFQEEMLWKLVWILAVFLSFCSLGSFGREMDGANTLDTSWQNYTYEVLLSKLRVGSDYIWSYGALGFLETPIEINRTLLAITVVIQLSLSIIYAHFVVKLFRKQHLSITTATLLITVLFLASGTISSMEYRTTLLAIILLLFVDINENNNKQIFTFISTGALLALAPLIKASMLVTTISFLIVFIVTMWSRFSVKLLILLGSTLFFWFIGFFVSGQSIYSAIITPIRQFDFFIGNSSMSTFGLPKYYHIMALTTMLSVVLLISFRNLLKERTAILILGLLSFQSFKESFIRQDEGHIVFYFSIIMWVAVFLWLIFKKYEGDFKYRSRIGLSFILLISFIILTNNGTVLSGFMSNYLGNLKNSFVFITNSKYTTDKLDQQKRDILNRRPELASFLPSFQNKSAFSYPWDINALYATTAKISQPPIPQEHFAFTKQFDKLNSDFFSSQQSAPDMGLISFQYIDGRLPLQTAPNTFLALLSNYEPYMRSGNDLLIKKRSTVEKTKTNLINTQTAKINQTVDVPLIDKSLTIAKINIKQTLWGKAVSFFYHQTPLLITETLLDGRQFQHRLVQQTLANGIIVSQSPENIDDLDLMFQRVPINLVKSFVITTPKQNQWENEYSIEFQAADMPKNETEIKKFGSMNDTYKLTVDEITHVSGTNYVVYRGWFFSKNEKMDDLRLGIQSKDGLSVTEYPYVIMSRPDVQKAFNLSSEMVGFKFAFPENNKDGKIVLLKHDNGGVKVLGSLQ